MALGKDGSSVLEPPHAVGGVPTHHLEVGVQQWTIDQIQNYGCIIRNQ